MNTEHTGPGSRPPWWKTGVIYEIPVASFADSDGDGYGDLRGIIERLDHVAGAEGSLGMGAIWLTPVYRTPFRDFGYDVADHRTIDPRFGTMADLDELLSACHERGIRLMMDLVLNHTSEEHPWFQQSRSSRDDPKRDWYVWRDGRAPGKPPNRWVSVVEGSAWEHDEATGQYYYHAFLPFQPDLNWRNPDVRREMLDVARFWLEKGVDGFRLDLVNFLFEDDECRDNQPRLGWRPYFWQHHRRDRSQPESVEAVKELRALADGYDTRALMGEVLTDENDDVIDYLGDGSDALHLSFYLDFARRPWRAEHFRDSVGWLEAHIPEGAWPCWYLNNHDLARSLTRYGRGARATARAKVAAAMLLTLRGTPIVYAGEEIGMPRSPVPRWRMRDPVGVRYWPIVQGRDGSRTPMQWDSGANAGFTTGEPWLPVDRSHVTRNVERESTEADSLLSWYRDVIRVRSASPALSAGSYRLVDDAPRGVFAYLREHDGERVAVLLNFTARRRTVRLAPPGSDDARWTTILSTHGPAVGASEDRGRVRLRPHEAALLGARSISRR